MEPSLAIIVGIVACWLLADVVILIKWFIVEFNGRGNANRGLDANELTQLKTENEQLSSKLEECLANAERYQWLRERLKVREERSMAGNYRDAIYIRVGQSFFHTPTRGAAGYTDPELYERECLEFDAAVDVARALRKEKPL